jgi:hypothetical protein
LRQFHNKDLPKSRRWREAARQEQQDEEEEEEEEEVDEGLKVHPRMVHHYMGYQA